MSSEQSFQMSDDDFESLLAHADDLRQGGKVELAMSILRLCSSCGDVTTKTRVADALSDPDLPIDFKFAEMLYKEACIEGYWPACANLAVLYRDLGDTIRSQRFLNRAKLLADDSTLDIKPTE